MMSTRSEPGPVPYPTADNHAQVVARHEQALAAWQERGGADEDGKPVPRPVPQPPTMLAAMHRADLTKPAREDILQRIAPKVATIERKYRLILNSSARESPAHTSTNDFTVRLGSDAMSVPVNGFELIGYSVPQAEFVVEPDQCSIPFRFGWVGVPRGRLYALRVRTYTPRTGLGSSFEYDGPDEYLACELPLVRNPITRIQVAGDGSTVTLTFARRVGTNLEALQAGTLILDNVGHPVVGVYPGRWGVTAATLQAPTAPSPVYSASTLPAQEDLLSERSVYDASAVTVAHQLVVTSAAFTQYFVAGADVRVTATSPFTSLGSLFAAPPKDAVALAAQMTRQLNALIALRQASAAASKVMPLSHVALTWMGTPSNRFRLAVRWLFQTTSRLDMTPLSAFNAAVAAGFPRDSVLPMLNPVRTAEGDSLVSRFSLPTASLPASLDVLGAEFAADAPPLLYAEDTVDAPPVPAEGDAFWSALNVTAASMVFAAQDTTKVTFYVPFRVPSIAGGSRVINVEMENGEYRPWSFAVALTEAIRYSPDLRGIDIVVTPSFLEYAGNSLAGFRFTSMAAIPQPFELAFDTFNTSSTTNQVINPTRLGYLPIAYTGRTVYDPKILSVTDDPFLGFSNPIVFPSAELGNGVPSPLPFIPRVLPTHSGRRLQIVQTAHPIAPVESVPDFYVPGVHTPVALTMLRPTLFHHLQPVRVTVSVPATELMFNNYDGVAEASGASAFSSLLMTTGTTTGDLMLLPPALTGTEDGRADITGTQGLEDIRMVFKDIHDPLHADGIANDMILLFGKVGTTYGSASQVNDTVGPYRQWILTYPTLCPGTPMEMTPTSAQIDRLLTDLGNLVQVRTTFRLLVQIMLAVHTDTHGGKAAGDPPTGAAATGSTTDSLRRIVAAYYNAASVPNYTHDFLMDLVNTAAWQFPRADMSAIAAGGSEVLYPGYTYVATLESAAATGTVSGVVGVIGDAGMHAGPTTVLFHVPHDHSGNIDIQDRTNGSWTTHTTHQYVIEADTIDGDDSFRVTAGRTYTVWFSAATDDVEAATAVNMSNVTVSAGGGFATFTVQHNVATVSISAHTADPASWTSGTYPVDDSRPTDLAKMLLIANNYTFSFPGFAHVPLSGTNRYPFNITAALTTLGVEYTSDEEATEALLEMGDPGVRSLQVCSVLPATSATGQFPPDLAEEPTVGWTRTDTRSMYLALLDLARSTSGAVITVAREVEHPMSLDFASATPRRIRPERMGFQRAEYSADLDRVVMPPGRSLNPATFGSVVDIQYGTQGILLLSVEINGQPTPVRSTMRPDGLDLAVLRELTMRGPRDIGSEGAAENSNVISIAESALYEGRQVITATAYVVLGAVAKLVDRSEDRAPQTFPTSTRVHTIRVRFFRPDGTLYNFHGRETTVVLRFMSHPDNPSFIAGSDK